MIGDCLDDVVHRRIKPNDTTVHYTETLGKYFNQYRRLFEEEKEYYGDLIGEVSRIIGRYVDVYKDDGLQYHIHEKRSSEIEIRIPLDDDTVFTGHIDKYPYDKLGRYWVMDHKSHKNIPDEDARYSDLQLVFYYWGAPLAGLPKPTGVLWDYIRTKPPSVPPMLKNGTLTKRQNIDTDYITYLTAIQQNKLDPKDYSDILEKLKAEGSSQFYRRVFLPSPPKQLVESVVRDIRETAQEIRFLEGVSKSRNMSRDCKSCSYFDLCSAEVRGLDTDFIRKTEYTQRVNKEVKLHDDKEEEYPAVECHARGST